MRLEDKLTDMGDPGRQLMFGPDWPLVKMRPYLKLLDELAFEPEQLENIAWRTAARLFRIDMDALPPRAPQPATPSPD